MGMVELLTTWDFYENKINNPYDNPFAPAIDNDQ